MTKTTTTLDATAVLCFAINNFGDGQHPAATAQSLPHFNPDYVRDCLASASRDERVKPDVRTFAKSQTLVKIKQLLSRSAPKPVVDAARKPVAHKYVIRDKATEGCDYFVWTENGPLARDIYHDAKLNGLDVELLINGKVQ